MTYKYVDLRTCYLCLTCCPCTRWMLAHWPMLELSLMIPHLRNTLTTKLNSSKRCSGKSLHAVGQTMCEVPNWKKVRKNNSLQVWGSYNMICVVVYVGSLWRHAVTGWALMRGSSKRTSRSIMMKWRPTTETSPGNSLQLCMRRWDIYKNTCTTHSHLCCVRWFYLACYTEDLCVCMWVECYLWVKDEMWLFCIPWLFILHFINMH